MSFDLSATSDDKLTLILLRVPVKNLIKNCPQVSRQWNRILSENHFWRQKMEQDGYQLEWTKLVGLSTRTFKCIALRQCFGRNFIKDRVELREIENVWDNYLTVEQRQTLNMDPRWEEYEVFRQDEAQINGDAGGVDHEIPPIFSDGKPKHPAEEFCDEPIQACTVTGHNRYAKRIVIKLSDEGLTDDIMDNFRPTIIVSEMVANRRDCSANYLMNCALQVEEEDDHFRAPNDDQEEREYREEHIDENGQWVSATITLNFKLGQVEEGWNRVEHQFKNYPRGMRYLSVMCHAVENRNTPAGHGCKLANCSVKALCEKNAE